MNVTFAPLLCVSFLAGACVELPAPIFDGATESGEIAESGATESGEVAETGEVAESGETTEVGENTETGGTAGTGETAGTDEDGEETADGETADGETDWAALSDGFEDGELGSAWTHLDLDAYLPIPSESVGSLHLYPADDTLWWSTETAGFIFKSISASHFRVSATVHMEAREGGPLTPSWRFVGLTMRDPTPEEGEGYVGVGVGVDTVGFNLSTKWTENDFSTRRNHGTPASADALLRLCRVGDDLYALERVVEGWVRLETFDLLVLPHTVQVGLSAYDWNVPADSHARVEEIIFAPVTTLADCYVDD